MRMNKVAITLDRTLLRELDALVKQRVFASRSQAIQQAVAEKLERSKRRRLAEQCALLDREYEQAFADESFASGLETWPEF